MSNIEGPDYVSGSAVKEPVYNLTTGYLGTIGDIVDSTHVTNQNQGIVTLTNFPPAAPSNGSEIDLELPASYDPIGGKIIRWKLSYDATNSVWLFIGGPPLYAEVTTAETRTSSTYGNLTTTGPAIALPRPGDYLVAHGCHAVNGTGTAPTMSYAIGATTASDNDAVESGGTSFESELFREREKTGLSAVTLTAKYRQQENTQSVTFNNRWMRVTPIRIT